MAVENKTISLSEINERYPKMYQTLGYDALFGNDSSNKPKVISTFQMVVNTILTLLFMKPGQYPSIPDLGIDIEKYLHEYADDPTITSEIINKLNTQCNRLMVSGVTFDCCFDKTSDGIDALVVTVEATERLAVGEPSTRVIIGISYDKLNKLYAKQAYI